MIDVIPADDGSTRLMAPAAAGAPIVALGASAGGLRAISTVLSGLPGTFPGAIVIVLHIATRAPNAIAPLLRRCSAMPVRQAADGDIAHGGTVYVAPPDHHLVIGDAGRLDLSNDAPVHHARPSVDRLFISFAESYGPRAVAVILTGCGVDGADGVRAVKARGGYVIVQDEHTSDFFGMPGAAVRTGCVDGILPLEQISPALISLLATRAHS